MRMEGRRGASVSCKDNNFIILHLKCLNDSHREIRDPGGAAGDLKEGDEGAVEDAELNRIYFAKEGHPDDSICSGQRRRK